MGRTALARSAEQNTLEWMNDAAPLTNWSIRLTEPEVVVFDELLYAMRKETDNRALTESDIFRSLVALTHTPELQSEFVGELRQLPRQAS
jgi:hypothetical protein